MEGVILLLLLLVVGVPIALFVWIGTKASRADRGVRDLEARVGSLQVEVHTLLDVLRSHEGATTGPPPVVAPPPKPVSTPLAPPVRATPLPPPIGTRPPQAAPVDMPEADETTAAPPPIETPASPW